MTDKFKQGEDDEAKLLREEAAALERNAHALEDTAHGMEDRAHQLEELAEEIEARHHSDDGCGDEHGHDGCHDHGGGHDHGDGGGHSGGDGHDSKVKITVVVNGAPTVVEAPQDELLGDVRKKALEQTGNLAQPPENWELKNEAGEALDPAKKVNDYHFGHEVTLFLSLSAGVAGV